MSFIVWDNSLSVNVGEIDRQHQKLVTMINELHDAMKAGKGKDVLGKILNGLISYTDIHFKAEEKYFHQFKYPDAVSHKKEHAALVRKVMELKDEFEHGRLAVSIEVLSFLKDWLQNHIKGEDKKYSGFFNEKGLR